MLQTFLAGGYFGNPRRGLQIGRGGVIWKAPWKALKRLKMSLKFLVKMLKILHQNAWKYLKMPLKKCFRSSKILSDRAKAQAQNISKTSQLWGRNDFWHHWNTIYPAKSQKNVLFWVFWFWTRAKSKKFDARTALGLPQKKNDALKSLKTPYGALKKNAINALKYWGKSP